MKKIVILLLCLLSAVNGFGITGDAINMSRVKKQLEQATKEFNLIQKSHKKAESDLMATPKGINYKQSEAAFEKCKRDRGDNGCNGSVSRLVYLQAAADLRETKEYREDFLPIDKEFARADYKRFGLQKMARYVDHGVDGDPIRAMYSGVHSALYVDADPNGAYAREIRDQVAKELYGLIKSEAQEFAIDKMERLMNN